MKRGFLFFLWFLAASASAIVVPVAKIERAERMAVVVVELATHAPADRRFFYEFVEAAAHAETKNRIKPIYGKVVLLSGQEASLPNVMKTLTAAANDSAIRAVDMFLHLHGSPGQILLHEGAHEMSAIRDQLSASKTLSKKLRALNSTACWGSTHLKDFLAAGFKVASGSRKVNANGAHDVPAFLTRWGKGETYAKAQDAGNDSRWISFYDKIAAGWGMGAVDSYKDIEGNSAITIDSDAL